MTNEEIVENKFRQSVPQSEGLSYDIGLGKVDDNPTVTLHNIDVQDGFRGKGYASKALKLLTNLADEYGVTLDLDVGHDEAEIDLVSWYARHGFVWHKRTGSFMIRYPNGINPDDIRENVFYKLFKNI